METSDCIYFGRQPIFDTSGKIEYYEVFYRDGENPLANKPNDRKATANVVFIIANYIYTKNIFENHKVFINIGGDLSIAEDILEVMDFNNFIFEVRASYDAKAENLEILQKIKDKGIGIAIDNIHCDNASKKSVKELIDYLQFIKIDFSVVGFKEAFEFIKYVKSLKDEIVVIGEKIESLEKYEEAKNCGASHFQGFFFHKPDTSKFHSLTPGAKGVFQIYNQLDRDVDTESIVKTLRSYPDIIINLLQYVNRASVAKTNEISSIRQAINYLGRKTLKTWLLLFLYTDSKMSKYSLSLLESGMIRAKLMQSLTKKVDRRLNEKAFLVGILSTLDALFNSDIKSVIMDTNFENDIKDALINRSGVLGVMLELSIASEKNDFKQLIELLDKLNIDMNSYIDMLKESFEWTFNHIKNIKG